jgi:hypothetical protein
MAAPIAVELASSAPLDPELARALIDTCSVAAGAGGCVLETPGEVVDARARVIVTFSGAEERVRVEIVASSAGGAGRARDASFRDDDPPLERVRATGLIVAGLVSDLAAGEPATDASGPAPATVAPDEPLRRVLVRLEGRSAWNGARPWVGAALGADLSIASPVFLALSGAYGQTWKRDAQGIAAQRTTLGLGAGVAAPLGAVELRVRVALELEELRASIHQPTTLREDAAGRTLGGLEASMDVVLPVTGTFAAFCGGRIDGWSGNTTVRVAGIPDEVIGAWMVSIAAGVAVRLK